MAKDAEKKPLLKGKKKESTKKEKQPKKETKK